jgi:hypothetical protein
MSGTIEIEEEVTMLRALTRGLLAKLTTGEMHGTYCVTQRDTTRAQHSSLLCTTTTMPRCLDTRSQPHCSSSFTPNST